MKADTHSMTGGVVMLFGLVVLLAVPMVVGHFALKSSAEPALHANASQAQ